MKGDGKNKSGGRDSHEVPNVNDFILRRPHALSNPHVLTLSDRNVNKWCSLCAKWRGNYRDECTGVATQTSANGNVPSGNAASSTTNYGNDANDGASTGDVEETGGDGYGN